MAAPLSQDLRRRLVRAVEAGSSAREAARRFEVSVSAAVKLVRSVRETGSTAPGQISGHRRPLPETTLLSADEFGTMAGFWMNLQTTHGLEPAQGRGMAF